MPPEKEWTFVLRRIAEEMPAAALAFPIALALVALVFLVLYLRKHKLTVFGVGSAVVIAGGLLYFTVGYSLREAVSWWLVIVPTLAVATFYVVLMYVQDAQTIHPLVAALLGSLRLMVYALLAFCFLLPGCQEYDTTITESKILVLFDVSGSMSAVDSHGSEGGTTRLEKIVSFITTPYQQGGSNKTFLGHLTDSSPVICYRFGATVDDEPVLLDAKSQSSWNADKWRKWLQVNEADIAVPENLTDDAKKEEYVKSRKALYQQLREGTDVGGSALQALQREGNSRIQAVIVVSDGNSNRGDEEAIRTILERAANPKRSIHVITVGVGEYKQPVRIRINPLVAPQAVRADDGGFEVRVPVYGDGLPGEEFEVTLSAQRIKDRIGIELKKEPVFEVGKQKGRFGGGGEFPFEEVVFKVNLEQFAKLKSPEDAKGQLQGTWNFIAKVPRNPREAADKDEPFHLSQAKAVSVNDSTLRVLLFADAPSRDYQFVRTLLTREVDAKRAKLSIYLQSSKGLEDVQQDVDGSHLLNDFPNKLERPKDGKKEDKSKEGDPMNLKSYDVIIAFDPEWKQLTKSQKELLKEWVEGDHGGGLIFYSGAAYMPTLIPPVDEAKFNAWDLKPIFSLLPVILARPPANVRADAIHDATIPYTLDFTGLAKANDFLRLDDEKEMSAGWKEFFGRGVVDEVHGVSKVHTERGFYTYLRVAKAKDGAEVLATFNDPKSPKTADGKAQPFFATLRVGKGKTFYIGSSEIFRLRAFKEEYYQRFWIKLARFVSSGSGGKSFGRFSMAGEYVTGIIPVEAEVRDKDGFPMSADASPIVNLRRVDGRDEKDEKLPTVQLKGKKGQGKWRGTFVGNLRLDREGIYEVRIDIPGADEAITQIFEVKAPNVEMSDLRTNFPKLFSMATDATPAMLGRLDRESREILEGGNDRPKAAQASSLDPGTGPRLFFRLASGQAITQCLTKVPAERESVKGALRDLWDRGPEVFNADSWEELDWLIVALYALPALVIGSVIVMMLFAGRQYAALGLGAALIAIEIGMVVLVFNTVPSELFQPSALGVLLVVPPLILLATAGILVVAERYYWAIGLLAGMVVYLAVLLLVEVLVGPDWPPMKVDLTWVLLAIGFLLSVEWFTRKMLRLA
jgi:hypothetical protein